MVTCFLASKRQPSWQYVGGESPPLALAQDWLFGIVLKRFTHTWQEGLTVLLQRKWKRTQESCSKIWTPDQRFDRRQFDPMSDSPPNTGLWVKQDVVWVYKLMFLHEIDAAAHMSSGFQCIVVTKPKACKILHVRDDCLLQMMGVSQ